MPTYEVTHGLFQNKVSTRSQPPKKTTLLQVLKRRKLPGALESLHKGLNLDKHLQRVCYSRGANADYHEMEEPSHLEFEIGADDQAIAKPSQHPEWFSHQKKPPTLDHDWNKTLLGTH
nr:hypothetical protein [Tanacetum cinerariifolium]